MYTEEDIKEIDNAYHALIRSNGGATYTKNVDLWAFNYKQCLNYKSMMDQAGLKYESYLLDQMLEVAIQQFKYKDF